MEKEGQKRFQNGKELLAGCVERLNENQSREAGQNIALFPTVILLLGEKCKPYTKYIKNTLEDNWNNARFLQYINIVKEQEQEQETEKEKEKEHTAWKCSILTQNEKNKEIDWEADPGTPDNVLCRSVVEMLQQDDRIFKEKSSIKMEFILDGTEEEGQVYYDLYLEIKNGLQAADLKTFYLMLDQKPDSEKSQQSEQLLRYILQKNNQTAEKNYGTIYLLSNYLSSGSILGPDKIWQNYRLTADIILLGGSRNSESGYVSKLYNGIKTASYALVTKPIDAIAAISLKTLLQKMYQQEKEYSDLELSEKEIRERLGITPTQGFCLGEQIFKEQIGKDLPLPKQFLYLPFCSKRSLRELQKMEQISIAEMDRSTMGAWSIFLQKNYLDRVQDFWEKEEEVQKIRKKMQELFSGSFSIFEILNLIPKKEQIKQLIQEEFRFDGIHTKAEFTEKLDKIAVYECKKYFYQKGKQVLIEELEQFFEQAKQYQELYAECEREVQKEILIVEEENASIEKLYGNEVIQYVEGHPKKDAVHAAFSEVFDLRLDKEGFLAAVWTVFLDLIGREIFNYDFEKELDFRINQMGDDKQKVYVKTKLQKTLSGSVRLRSLTDVMERAGCFYMIHGSANYAKQLAKQDGNFRDFMLFYLNRSDCMEQIEIYDITKPEAL